MCYWESGNNNQVAAIDWLSEFIEHDCYRQWQQGKTVNDTMINLYPGSSLGNVSYRIWHGYNQWIDQCQPYKINHVVTYLSKLHDGTATKIEGIFYEGEVFSARAFIEDLIKSAQHEIILIDAYVDATILNLLTLRAPGVAASVYTGQIKPALQKAHTLHNQQYPDTPIRLQTYSNNFHDRFIIIDDTVYHVGASLKDLGKRLFAFTRMELNKSILLAQL